MTMMRNNLTLCLHTSAKGHFGRHDIYQQTVTSLLAQVPSESWGALAAHVNEGTSNELQPIAIEMEHWLSARSFYLMTSRIDFAHFSQTHQDAYLHSISRLTSTVKTPYVLHVEDDWLITPYDHDLEYWLHAGVVILEENPALMQVRIPRFSNEAERIVGLRAKHGIDGRVDAMGWDNKAFRETDFSLNPCIMRTRDLRAAVAFTLAANVEKHVEHGLGTIMKMLSGSNFPFACFNPERIRCGHLGVARPEQADDLSKPLLAS